MKPLLIVHRTKSVPHMEVHYVDHVEFWTYDNQKIGESTVEPVTPQ